jgi:anti-sigma regulatory factor (Ser/Thr protein kinase)/DNA-binding NarL/FixJ family response regulator
MSRVLVIGNNDALSQAVREMLTVAKIPAEVAFGSADALQRLRTRSFGVVITSGESRMEEDLALLGEIRRVRPAVRCIVLSERNTPQDVIAALRAQVFACFSEPFDARTIASLAEEAASDSDWRSQIQVLSAKEGWVSLHANCGVLTAERLITFMRELNALLPTQAQYELIEALREILMNAIEHGAAFNPEQYLHLTAVRTARTVTFYVRDPGGGFRVDSLGEDVVAGTSTDPIEHIKQREEAGMRPGGYGLLLARGTVDELIYNDTGNEVVLIKYTDRLDPASRP